MPYKLGMCPQQYLKLNKPLLIMTAINSVDLCKKFSSSNTIKSFIEFIEGLYLSTEVN